MKPTTRVDDYGRECTKCGEYKNWDYFCKGVAARGMTSRCLNCRNEDSRQNPNLRSYCNKYEKTKRRFLMRLYRNMQSRILGIQKQKHHLYEGKYLLNREDFYYWAINCEEFHRLYSIWEASEYDRKLCPTVDRIDSSEGYHLDNMEWVTHSENSRRGSARGENVSKV